MANEKRLIDANAFECLCVNGKSDDFCNGVLYVLDMIDAQPTVDAVPVVHGRWINSRYSPNYGEYEEQCSYCKEWSSVYGKPYCPNCGAKMDGDDHVQP